jgi:pimeloyl-ACP methyl ester carboxylesterase
MNTLAFKIAWRLALYPALAVAVLSFVFFWLYAHPRRYVGAYKPADFGLKAEELKLKTSDGIELAAWFIPHGTSKRSVVICHGYPMDKSDVLGLTSFLARDFNLLYFDFRATGRSGGFFSTGGAREVRDIDAGLAFLEGRLPGAGIGIFGFSMGAGAALHSRNPAIKARVLDAPLSDLSGQLHHIFGGWGLLRAPLVGFMKVWSLLVMGVNINSVSPVRNTAAYSAPMLLIHGDADTAVPPGNSLAIKAANPAAELWLVKGAGHGENHYRAPAEYEKRVAEFLRRSL